MLMEDKVVIRRQNIVKIMSQREEFIIIGLTGKIGSGCSEAAAIFGSSFKNLELPWIHPDTNGFDNNEDRDKRILERYASAHWLKFDVIKTRTIISTFLLGKGEEEKFDEFLNIIFKHIDTNTLRNILNTDPQDEPKQKDLKQHICHQLKDRIELQRRKIPETLFMDDKVPSDEIKALNESLDKLYNNTNNTDNTDSTMDAILKKHVEICDKLGEWYNKVDEGKCLDERSRVLTEIETCLFDISASYAKKYLVANESNIFKVLRALNDNLSQKYYDETDESSTKNLLLFSFVNNIMPTLGDIVHELVSYSSLSFTELFQKYGNSIRRYGDIFFDSNIKQQSSDVFCIPRKINQFIKALRHPFSNSNCRPVRVVIDSIKNVFEATYLRQRYSAFYLFAISADEDIRKNRLMKSDGKNMTMRQINFADWNEYSSIGCEIYTDGKNGKLVNHSDRDDKKAFYEHIIATSDEAIKDDVRKEAYALNQQQYYLQDVASSIENADVFISNNHKGKRKNMKLKWEIVRNVCLIMFPGLLLPTPVERCMQVAFAAKCNSGCLSRQVGAVVTDKDYNILSIGWNDVPCGDISCARKNLVDLCKFEDQIAYTKYELENESFRERLSNFDYHENFGKLLKGLPMRYCFKDIHMDEKNPMRSRAMHAEEKALANCGDNSKGGYLFTTSSPCEMCSKNAKNHQIKNIYYIELYPGISEDQYSMSGNRENIAKHVLFTGAIGRAYTQMYTPIMPQKDIINFLGVNKLCWKNETPKPGNSYIADDKDHTEA